MEIIIGGDLVPTNSNIELFNNADVSALLGKELLSLWNDSDERIFNLEVPLCDNEKPIPKCGPNLIAPLSTIKGIKALKPSTIGLANNHILDQGVQGLDSTIKVLLSNGIPAVGVGNNVFESSRPYIINSDNLKIGIYACAETEFSIATNTTPGANPFDPLESLDHIQDLKTKCDYVVILYHGGKEHYRYPSPYLQKVCRKMAQKGADLIICQHSHCIGCFEEYMGSTIVYGQGNFIFNKWDNEFWKTSLLIKVCIDKEVRVEYIPLLNRDGGVRLAEGHTAEKILSEFFRRSHEIKSEGFIEQQYKKFSQEKRESYLSTISGFNKWLSRIDRHLLKGMLLKKKYNKKQLLVIQNYIECEAHRELLLNSIKSKGEKINA